MALLEDQLEEARQAFHNAHEANDVEAAKALSERVFELEAQKAAVDKATLESSQAGTDFRNPMIAAGTGAVVGATVNPTRGAIHNIITPPAAAPKVTAPAPSALSTQLGGHGGQDWTKALTGVDIPGAQMNKGSLDTAQRMAQTVGRGGELAGGKITEGGIMLPPEIGAKPTPVAPRSIAAQTKQAGKSLLQGIAGEPQPMSPFSIVKGGARGAVTGGVLADIPQQLKQGNYGTAASDLGVAAGNIAHGLAKTPKGKAIGTLLGLGSGVLRGYQGINELTGEPEQQKAAGGLAHLAGGGQPEFGEARAYEPSYSEKIRDYAAKHIGREQANRLFAGPNARPEDIFNPVSMALQTPGVIADSATGFVKSAQEGDYLGGMGHYLTGALNVAPMLKPAGKFGKMLMPKMAGGGDVLKAGADVAKKVKGFLEHTPTKPNPLVGTRYKTTDLGGLIEPTPFDIEKAIGAKVMHRPYDLSSRNQLVEEVSGHRLLNPITTEGGQPFGRDIKLQATGQGGASNKNINDKILKRVDVAAQEGNGQVFNIPSTMGYGSEAFSTMPMDILLDLIKQRELPKETLEYLSNLVRAKSPALQNFVGFGHPEVAKQLTEGGFGLTTTPGKLRVGATQAMMGKQSGAQSLIDYNQEDLFNAIRAPELRNVPPGYMGETVMEAVPGHPGFRTGNHGAYDSGDSSIYRGQGVNAPISLWMPDNYRQALAEIRSNPKTAEKALGHQRAMARNVLGTAESGVAQTITPQVADNLQRYQEAVKAGTLDPSNLDQIHKFIYGAKAEHYAPGGKVGAIKKIAEDLQAAYKSKFTPGFYHGSPNPNITAFDPLKSTVRDTDFVTPGVTFVTKHPKFADSFTNGKGPYISLKTGEAMPAQSYTKGATMYPVSVDMSNHFDPTTPEGRAIVESYVAKKYAEDPSMARKFTSRIEDPHSNWTTMESPSFLQHLRDTGHTSFAVNESGYPNVGVLDPSKIRGKFAEFNPEHAADPDFMKAEGGSVEGYAPGGKVGMLNELMQLIKQQGGTTAAKRLERAADLVPNLENKFQPQTLKSAFTGDNASAMMVMKPGDFQKYATPLPESHKSWDQFTIADQNKKGNYQDYLDYLGRVSNQGGFSSVPYLELNKEKGDMFSAITGHEGRNRSDALAKLGDQSSLVQMLPRASLREQFPRRSQEEYLNALQGELGSYPMVTSQPDWDPIKEKWIRRGLRDLPELFKKGGDV